MHRHSLQQLLMQSRYRFISTTRRLLKLVPFKLADIGEGITEVEIIQWHVKEGQEIRQFDKIAEFQSDKANVEITSRFDGTVKKLYHDVGGTAKVGAPLVDIEVAETKTEASSDEIVDKKMQEREMDKEIQAAEEFRDEIVSSAEEVLKDAPTEKFPEVKILPSVRRKAKELNVDLAKIIPTGNHGQITIQDVIQASKPEKTRQTKTANGSKVVPLTMFQKAMVKAMTESMKIPHFGFHDDIHMDRLLSLRSDLRDSSKQNGVELTPLHFIIKALSMALRDFPQINAHYNSEKSELRQFTHHNIGVAVDTEHGLAVPVLRNVAEMSIMDISKELNRLTKLARSNKLSGKDISDATITISNVGVIGGTTANPIIPSPQLAIVALGHAERVPKFDKDGKVVPVTVMPISWAADHRVVDGATIARFSQRWRQLIEAPAQLIL